MKFKVATLHEANDRCVAWMSRVKIQRRVPSCPARPFPEAFPPVFRHKPFPGFDQATVASSAVSGNTAGAADTEFTIADHYALCLSWLTHLAPTQCLVEAQPADADQPRRAMLVIRREEIGERQGTADDFRNQLGHRTAEGQRCILEDVVPISRRETYR